MHMHGHDPEVLGSGYGNFDTTMKDSLTLVNGPRRDVVMLPASGYVVIAIKTVNPGVDSKSDVPCLSISTNISQ